MTRKTFDRELEMVNTSLTEMGKICVEGIDIAISLISSRADMDTKARRAAEIERETDRLERDVEDLCMKMILRQQPVASDLKFISEALHIISDMERIGDNIMDIVEIISELGNGKVYAEDTLKEMGRAVMDMISGSLESFVERDSVKAQTVVDADRNVDSCFMKLKEELLRILYSDISKEGSVFDVFMIGKYFERMGDHGVNIAEAVISAC